METYTYPLSGNNSCFICSYKSYQTHQSLESFCYLDTRSDHMMQKVFMKSHRILAAQPEMFHFLNH